MKTSELAWVPACSRRTTRILTHTDIMILLSRAARLGWNLDALPGDMTLDQLEERVTQEEAGK